MADMAFPEFLTELLVQLAAQAGAEAELAYPGGAVRIRHDADGTQIEKSDVIDQIVQASLTNPFVPLAVYTIAMDDEGRFRWKGFAWILHEQGLTPLEAARLSPDLAASFPRPRQFDVDPDVYDEQILWQDAYTSAFLAQFD